MTLEWVKEGQSQKVTLSKIPFTHNVFKVAKLQRCKQVGCCLGLGMVGENSGMIIRGQHKGGLYGVGIILYPECGSDYTNLHT